MRMLVTLLSRFITWTRIVPYPDNWWECAIHEHVFIRRVGAHGRICAACHDYQNWSET